MKALDLKMKEKFGQNIVKISKEMLREDEQKKEHHRLKVVQNASANAELANQKFISM